MVARDVGMEVLPDALDAVRVGAVRRQEVEHDAALERLEEAEGRACRVDAVVVEDDVDVPHAPPVALVQQLQEIAEQAGVLSCGARGVQHAGADIERSGQVELLVLAGGDDAALPAGEHPVAPDLRIEVDVDLVDVEYRLRGARALLQRADLGQPSLARVALPRAEDDGLGHAAPRPDARKHAPHGADVDGGPALALHLQAQKLARPGGALPTEVLWRTLKKLRNPRSECAVRLAFAVAASFVVEPLDALLREAVRRAHNRRWGDVEHLGDLGAALARAEQGHSMKAQRCREIAALASEPHHEVPLHPAHSGYTVHVGLLVVGRLAIPKPTRSPAYFHQKLELIDIPAR